MNTQPHPSVDSTIKKYLTDKVREKFAEDFHLIEPVIGQLVAKYSLKELYMICSVEINKIKNAHRRPGSREL